MQGVCAEHGEHLLLLPLLHHHVLLQSISTFFISRSKETISQTKVLVDSFEGSELPLHCTVHTRKTSELSTEFISSSRKSCVTIPLTVHILFQVPSLFHSDSTISRWANFYTTLKGTVGQEKCSN